MPAPTDLLNEDVKELKVDLRDIRSNLEVLKADVHRIDVELAEFRAEIRTQFKDLIGVATWGVKLAVGSLVTVVGTIIAGAAGASWWASNITAEVRYLSGQVADLKAGIEAGRRSPTNIVAPEPKGPSQGGIVPEPKPEPKP